jgi:hypothetical protein
LPSLTIHGIITLAMDAHGQTAREKRARHDPCREVFMKLGYLLKSDYENWRLQRVSPLERVLNVNLSRIHFIMKTVCRNSLNGHVNPRMTVYKSWGKGKQTLLQFSTSGDPTIETA